MQAELTYQEKLRDPKWQRLRLLIFDRDEWACQSCGCKDQTLHIHHLKYFPGLEPWEYELHFLVTYCETCHESEHLIGETIRESLLELIQADKIYFKPLAQLCVLIEDYPPFYRYLKEFLNDMMIEHLKSKHSKAA